MAFTFRQCRSSRKTAAALVDIAEGAPVNGTVSWAARNGFRLDELVRRFLSATDDPRHVVTDVHAPATAWRSRISAPDPGRQLPIRRDPLRGLA